MNSNAGLPRPSSCALSCLSLGS